jgi:hypothetical protein
LLVDANDRAGALEAAEQAAQRLERQPSANCAPWAQLAGVFQRLYAPSASKAICGAYDPAPEARAPHIAGPARTILGATPFGRRAFAGGSLGLRLQVKKSRR